MKKKEDTKLQRKKTKIYPELFSHQVCTFFAILLAFSEVIHIGDCSDI